MSVPRWEESYLGGSPEAERQLFQQMASDINVVQDRWRARASQRHVRRAFHAKTLAAVSNAEFRVLPAIDDDLRVGFLQPGAVYRATVRFSNAHATVRSDKRPDLRGVAIRIHVSSTEYQDLLLTNAPASHARDAHQFMVAAKAFSMGRLRGSVKLVRELGVRESFRLAVVLARGMLRPVHSLSTESYWSRAATAVGPVAVKFKLQSEVGLANRKLASGPEYLTDDFVLRLQRTDVEFTLQVQHFVDAGVTPIEDGAARWKEMDTPPEPVARLTIPRQDLSTPAAKEEAASIERLAFDPWNTTDGFRPLGNLNRARAPVYEASASHRSATRG